MNPNSSERGRSERPEYQANEESEMEQERNGAGKRGFNDDQKTEKVQNERWNDIDRANNDKDTGPRKAVIITRTEQYVLAKRAEERRVEVERTDHVREQRRDEKRERERERERERPLNLEMGWID
ncbi:hypothetical protein BDV19DRAFT_198110 [Aspergillus venezuelensis]